MVYASITHEYGSIITQGDIYWCTAYRLGVHTYIVYGPLANGVVTLMFEGVPNYQMQFEILECVTTLLTYAIPPRHTSFDARGDSPVKAMI